MRTVIVLVFAVATAIACRSSTVQADLTPGAVVSNGVHVFYALDEAPATGAYEQVMRHQSKCTGLPVPKGVKWMEADSIWSTYGNRWVGGTINRPRQVIIARWASESAWLVGHEALHLLSPGSTHDNLGRWDNITVDRCDRRLPGRRLYFRLLERTHGES